MLELFKYGFLIRALSVGILVALCAGLLGVTLVLKRYSMIGDGLSHVSFGALSIALALNASPMYFALPVIILAAFLLLRISENSKIKADAAIALISSSSLAIGVIVTSLSGGVNINVYDLMFGSVLAVTREDLVLCIVLALLIVGFFIFYYRKIFAVTFDEDFAKAIGVRVSLYKMLFATLTAVTIVVGMRIMGALLISSLIIFPALSSMRVFKDYLRVVICSAILSTVCVFFGIALSYAFSLPAGASIVCVNLIVFLLFWCIGVFRKV